MAMQKRLKCPKCDRAFAMPAHLGRHMNTVHGGGAKSKAAARKGRKRKARVGRPPARAKTTGFNLAGLSLTELCQVIELARGEAKRRLETL